jgi:hypothetical protein
MLFSPATGMPQSTQPMGNNSYQHTFAAAAAAEMTLSFMSDSCVSSLLFMVHTFTLPSDEMDTNWSAFCASSTCKTQPQQVTASQ